MEFKFTAVEGISTKREAPRTFIEFTGLSRVKVAALLGAVYGEEALKKEWEDRIELHGSTYRVRLDIRNKLSTLQLFADKFAQVAQEKLGQEKQLDEQRYDTLVSDLKTLGR